MHNVMQVARLEDIPELNEYQCGTYTMHSLEEARESAQMILDNGIGINKNEDIALSNETLKALGNQL